MVTSSLYLPKSRHHTTFQAGINETNLGDRFAYHIEAYYEGTILARSTPYGGMDLIPNLHHPLANTLSEMIDP